MNDGYPPLKDTGDDLPRTLRREREARERAAREQEARDRQAQEAQQRGLAYGRPGVAPALDRAPQPPAVPPSVYGKPETVRGYERDLEGYEDEPKSVTVTRIKVPFFSLMGFFIKAVFAAVPALLILMAMLYGLGIVLQTYFPQLIKMKILISFPN